MCQASGTDGSQHVRHHRIASSIDLTVPQFQLETLESFRRYDDIFDEAETPVVEHVVKTLIRMAVLGAGAEVEMRQRRGALQQSRLEHLVTMFFQSSVAAMSWCQALASKRDG